MVSGNTYHVCLGKKVIPWDPHDPTEKINLHTDYFGKSFVALEKQLKRGGWTFYLTWDVNHLPTYGPRVIPVVLGDEKALVPRYENRVPLIFKCYGVKPALGSNLWKRPGYQNILTLLQYVYALRQFTPGWISRKFNHGDSRTFGRKRASIYPIPLGYANQVEVPFIPLIQRDYDVSFAGSIVHKPYKWWSLQKWFKTPKSYSRSKMFAALHKVRKTHPEWKIGLKITSSYGAIREADPLEYSEQVMNSKISLVPRGASYETFRFFESMRSGSIIISEYLPPFWFYKDAPLVPVANWRDLEKVLVELLENPTRLNHLHQKTLEWWENVCSEEALGSFMASKINELIQENGQSRKPSETVQEQAQ